MNDFRFAFRQLLKNPGFTAAAVMTLALGIGANTAIFSVVNGVLLRPLPYPEPGDLLQIHKESPPSGRPAIGGGAFVGGHEFQAWRTQSETLAHLAAYSSSDRTLSGSGPASRVLCGEATAALFPMLGVKPLLGRLILPQEEAPNGARVALLSHAFWQRSFGGDSGVLNRTLTLDGSAWTIVGVLPASFQFPEPNEIWLPMRLQPVPEAPGAAVAINLFRAMARVKPGVSLAQAEAELNVIASRANATMFTPPPDVMPPRREMRPPPPGAGPMTRPFPGEGKAPGAPPAEGPGRLAVKTQPAPPGFERLPALPSGDAPQPATAPDTMQDNLLEVAPRIPPAELAFGGGRVRLARLHEQLVTGVRASLLVLMGAVAFVLLIGCANVANLLLARSVSRQREIAIRAALGAPRGRLVRQFLVESVTLALMGAGLGLFVAKGGISVLSSMDFVQLPHLQRVELDVRVLLFTLVIALGTGILFGLWPALQAVGFRVNDVLKEGSAGAGDSRGRHRVSGGLVVVETALALVMLAGAGLLAHSFVRLRSMDPGFAPEGVLTFQLKLDPDRYPGASQRSAFSHRLREEIESLPGVAAAATTDHLPLTSYSLMTSVSVAGEPREKYLNKPPVSVASVTPNYFSVLGVALREGRPLADADQASGGILVNERFAREYFPGESAVGKQLNNFEPEGWGPTALTIAGVVNDVRQSGLGSEAGPEMYRIDLGRGGDFFSVAVKSRGDLAQLGHAVRLRVQEMDPGLAVYNLMSMRERLDATTTSPRANLVLLGSLAGLSLILACVGIYGVMSFIVSQRTREIGVRMALGAGAGDVLRMVVGHGMRLVAAGLAIGFALALVVTQFLRSMLYEVGATDPLTFALVPVVLASVAVVACWLPARRAAAVDPVRALRYE